MAPRRDDRSIDQRLVEQLRPRAREPELRRHLLHTQHPRQQWLMQGIGGDAPQAFIIRWAR